MAPPGVRVNVACPLLTPGEDRLHMKCVFHQEVTEDKVACGTKCLHSGVPGSSRLTEQIADLAQIIPGRKKYTKALLRQIAGFCVG